MSNPGNVAHSPIVIAAAVANHSMHARNPNTILVATDFTTGSRAAFDSGVRMAKEDGGRVVLVHAVRPLGAPGLELTRPDTTSAENETAQPARDADATGNEWVDVARSQGVAVEVVVRPGLPAKIIAEEAERVGASTVVLGSSKDDLEKAVIGSVAQAVREATAVPVVVVPRLPKAAP